jgi:ribokinase
MSKKRLLTYGDLEMDVIIKIDSLSAEEEDARAEQVILSPGGSAANCAAVASSLGISAAFLGNIGKDQWANLLREDLKKHHVNTSHLRLVDGPAAVCICIVNHDGNRSFYSYRGVNEMVSSTSISDTEIGRFDCLHLSGYSFQTPSSAKIATRLIEGAKKKHLLISLDPAYLFTKNLDLENNEILKHVDFFFPNREEAYLLTKIKDPLKAALKIREHGPRVVIVTLDKEGCLVVSKDTQQFIKIETDVEVVDSTGAGDAFCGGFLTGVLNGLRLDQACKVGSAAAAHIITRLGAHEQCPNGEDIIKIIEKNNDQELVTLLKKIFISKKFWR